MRLLLSAAALAACCGSALAAAPVAESLTPGFSFSEYAGTAPLGIGAVDVDGVVFYIDEKAVDGTKSWLLFYDAARERSFVSATIRFDAPILDVISTRAGLDATTPVFGADSVTYSSVPLTGLERSDTATWTPGGTTLDLRLITIDPGDHIRVLTAVSAVPEPGAWALMLGGLGFVGWLRRRRR